MKFKIYFTAILVAVFALACSSTPKKADNKLQNKLKTGDVIPDFTLPLHDCEAKKISFNEDIKGKSNVIALVFTLSESSNCSELKYLLSDLAIKFGEDFKAYEINSECNDTILSDGKVFNIHYKLSDPDFIVPRRFGFIQSPSLVIAGKDGKVLYTKSGYEPRNDSEEIMYVVKEAIKLARKRGFLPLSPFYKLLASNGSSK